MNHEGILTRAPWMDPVYPADVFFALMTILLVLESCRRVVGGVLALVTGCFLASTGGQLMPPVMGSAAFIIAETLGITYLQVCVAATVLVSLVRRDTRMGPRKFIGAMENGARSAAGIIVGVIAYTGLGFKFMTLVLGLATGHLFLALFFTMVASIILGMGVPTTPAYIIVAVIAAPSLIEVGVAPLVAYMFVFAMLSAITPPVAVAGYAGANIAVADTMQTSFTAWRLALIGFVVPYMFVYSPELLAQGAPLVIARVFVTGLIGVTAVGFGMYGWFLAPMPLWGRAAFLAGGLGLVYPSLPTDLMGLALIGVPAVLQIARAKKAQQASVPSLNSSHVAAQSPQRPRGYGDAGSDAGEDRGGRRAVL